MWRCGRGQRGAQCPSLSGRSALTPLPTRGTLRESAGIDDFMSQEARIIFFISKRARSRVLQIYIIILGTPRRYVHINTCAHVSRLFIHIYAHILFMNKRRIRLSTRSWDCWRETFQRFHFFSLTHTLIDQTVYESGCCVLSPIMRRIREEIGRTKKHVLASH